MPMTWASMLVLCLVIIVRIGIKAIQSALYVQYNKSPKTQALLDFPCFTSRGAGGFFGPALAFYRQKSYICICMLNLMKRLWHRVISA